MQGTERADVYSIGIAASRWSFHESRSATSAVEATVLSTYHAASGRAAAMARLLAKAVDSREQHVLARLRALELARMAVAQDALTTLWGLELPAPGAAIREGYTVPFSSGQLDVVRARAVRPRGENADTGAPTGAGAGRGYPGDGVCSSEPGNARRTRT